MRIPPQRAQVDAASMTTHTITQTPSTSPQPTRRRSIGAAALTAMAGAAAAVLLPMGPAAAETPPLPPATHCPAAFPLLAISQFDPIYQSWLHDVVDVNGNGYVCAKQQPAAISVALDAKLGLPPGSPVYLAGDDSEVR